MIKLHSWHKLVEDRPMEHVRRRRIVGQQAMISEIRLTKGCHVPLHSHVNEQFVILLAGRARFQVGDETCVMEEGQVLEVPANVPHSCTAEEDC
ncbi:MAG: cupin domain-containing protein, partial [Phycisphaerales bacterium]|nr:cupin domain-containing protein [Phycisphaerales bacterium]